MASGLDAIRSASQEIEARKNSGGDTIFVKELWPGLRQDRSSVVVRFLDSGSEIVSAWTHEYRRPGASKSEFYRCLDSDSQGEPCPVCEMGVKRTFKGAINLIWRNSPIVARDSEGKAVKNEAGEYVIDRHEDIVATWFQGITVFEELADADATYKGLTTRDFKITRKGLKLTTRYTIVPSDPDAGAVPFSDKDTELSAQRYDLNKEYFKKYSYDELKSIFQNGAPAGGGVSEEAVNTSRANSPFGARPDRANRFIDED